MEYSIVLVVLVSMTVISKVEGYYSSDLNNTSTLSSARNNRSNKYHYHNELIERTRYKYQSRKQFEQSFEHYRSDRREPRFVSFQTKDDNIEVEIDFAIPFLSIPVKRSLSGAMGTLQNVISGIPMANVNVGAVLLTGIVIIGGTMIGGIGRLLNGGSFLEIYGGAFPWLKSGNKRQKRE
ncbi:hypothetical protein PVAND_000028 [Polypedilum vanderplanki]|uniref:Uncharacterized protein n=1 Tax=Polypedilum vanderplanki TaxID=319348 RepID=A0A9J6BK26_POLVA|nr:hypothetical protein PVAND_000028 [Polypedilum vanderplanki]